MDQVPRQALEMLYNLSESLPVPKRGTIESYDGGETITVTTSDGSSLPAAARLCVSRYTTRGGVVVETPGTLFNGHFVADEGNMVGVASIGSPTGDLNMVSFRKVDQIKCPKEREEPLRPHVPSSSLTSLPYYVQTRLMELAPNLDVLTQVWKAAAQTPPTRRMLLVACANGLFLLTTTRPPSSMSTADSLYRNILEVVTIVLDMRSLDAPSSSSALSSSRGFIMRLGKNALAVMNSREQVSAVEALQRELGVATYPNARSLAEKACTEKFDISQSVLDVSSGYAVISVETLKKIVDNPRAVREEPLAKDWMKPETTFQGEMTVARSSSDTGGDGGAALPASTPAAAPPRRESSTFCSLLAGGEVGLEITVTHPPLRDVRPGESSLNLDKQFERVVTDALSNKLGGSKEHTSDWLESATKECRKHAQEMLKASQLFPDSNNLKVSLQLSQVRQPGTLIELPSGLVCVVPRYAEQADQPRLNALIGVLRYLRVSAAFLPWGSSITRHSKR
jgi:hypothetical protein